MAAALATMIPGAVAGIVGIGWLIGSRDRGMLTEVAHYLMAFGAAAVIAGGFRLLQASRASRAFRGNRPFVRP